MKVELLNFCGDPPCGAPSILDPAPFVFILLLDWLLHRDRSGYERPSICRVHVRDVDVHIGRDGLPIRRGIGKHDDGVVDANLGMYEFARVVRESPQLDGTEDSLQEVYGSIRAIDNEIGRDGAVFRWLCAVPSSKSLLDENTTDYSTE